MNDYEKGWADRTEVETAWLTYRKGIQSKGFIIGTGLLSAFAFGGLMAGAISMIATDWVTAIPITLLALMLGMPLFMGPWALDDRVKQIKEHEEAVATLKKHNIKGF